jgi:hypothetical protein
MVRIFSVRLDIDVTDFTDSNHRYQLCIICNNHEYAPVKHSLYGFLLTLVVLHLMPNVLKEALN